MKKKIFALLICFALLLAMLPSIAVMDANAAVTRYNPTVALKFASEHWNDGYGLCAEFVSRCLRAGGCDSYNPSCTALVGLLRNRNDCKEYRLPINSDRTITMAGNLDKIAPGDPFFFHCGVQQNYQHALLCNGMDSAGRVKAYAHNMPSDGSHAITYGMFCPECGQPSIDYVTVFHFNTMNPKISAWMSDSKMGSVPNQFFVGDQYYLCYKIYDKQSGTLYDPYKTSAYKVSMEVYNPDGSFLCSDSYWNDNNWLSVRCPMEGKYTYKVTVAGALNETIKGSFEVKNSTIRLLSKSKNETLGLSENTEKKIEMFADGFYTNPLSVKLVDNSNGIFLASLDSFEDQSVKISLKANKIGSGTITVLLFDAVTSELLDSETVNISVHGTDATILYNANGGTQAPAPQRAYCNEEVFLSPDKPVGKEYTVSFNANGGEISEAEKTYTQEFTAWNTEADGSGKSFAPEESFSVDAPTTLFAQYDNCIFEYDNVPTREGYYFTGWYDSSERDSYNTPTGKCFMSGSEIDSDMTLYAMWSSSPDVLYGDLNYDGRISSADLLKLNDGISGKFEFNQTDAFLADLDANGTVDADDLHLLGSVLEGTMQQENIPAYLADSQVVVGDDVKTEYTYGEKLNTENLALYINYSDKNCYCISEGLTVSGYDANQLGEQMLLVSFGQFSAEYRIRVNAPECFLSFNANGGTVDVQQLCVTYGSALGELPVPIRSGYTFVGWSLNPDREYISSDTIYDAFVGQTAYACWKEGCSEKSHIYEATIVSPTCSQNGHTEYTCKLCGQSYLDHETDPIEHHYVEGFCMFCGVFDPSYVNGACDGKAHCPGSAFVDYPKPRDWSHDGIDFCLRNGLFNGVTAKKFLPGGTMTRAMLVTVLYRMEGKPKADAVSMFSDVKRNAWYADAVIWAAENGIVNGVTDDLFRPEMNITREQMATIFFRYASYKNYNTSAVGDLKNYPDEKLVGTWAYDALRWATGLKLINGNARAGSSYLDPQKSATRAQTATILMRFMQTLCK